MRCEDVRDQLDGYLAKSLSADQLRRIDEHLDGCAECQIDSQAASSIDRRLPALQREIQPATDLWSGIAPRLGPRRRFDLQRAGMAAAALLLVAASSTVTWLVMRNDVAQEAVAFQSLEADYARAALELTQLYSAARATMAPATREVLERNLAVIERALEEARTALRGDPDNSALEAIVTTAYRRKIEFLERATTLDRES
jgi:predicted anti-sigma-YlaC factor YlaD